MNMADLRTTIFVGNLSVFCTEQDLEQVFSRYGTILEIRMAKSEDKSKHLSYGFVKFASVASAQLATMELDGRILCGRPLKIGKALSRSTRKIGGKGSNTLQYDTASVHVTFISNQIVRVINEQSLRDLFAQFGEVVDAVICKSNLDQRAKRQSGYGFIHYPGTLDGINASFRAAEALMDIMIDDVNYKCKISRQLEQQLMKPSMDERDDDLLDFQYQTINYSRSSDRLAFSVPPIQIPNSGTILPRYSQPLQTNTTFSNHLPYPTTSSTPDFSHTPQGLSRSAVGTHVANSPRTSYNAYNPISYTPPGSSYRQQSLNTLSMNSIAEITSNLSSLSMDTAHYSYPAIPISNAATPLANDGLMKGEISLAPRDNFAFYGKNPFPPSSAVVQLSSEVLNKSVNEVIFLDEERTINY